MVDADPVRLTARLLEVRRSAGRLFGERWPQKSSQWQGVIRTVMKGKRLGAIEATMLLIADRSVDGLLSLILLGACCDLIEGEKRAPANG